MANPTETKKVPEYVYKAFVTEIYDGDTWTLDIDLGFGVWLRDQKVRLYGINTPEVRGEERPKGLLVRDYCRINFYQKPVVVKTYRDAKGKYGRWLGTIYYGTINVNAALVNLNYAEERKY